MTGKITAVFVTAVAAWLVGVNVLIFTSADASSAELATFRISGIEGELGLRYFSDDFASRAGSHRSSRKGTTFEEELEILVHSYFYHPNLVRFDFGGGPIFIQNEYDDSGSLSQSSDSQYFNFRARASVLEKKLYPLTLYYQRGYGTSTPAAQDRTLLERTSYGLNFSLRRPLLPVLVNFHLGTTESKASNVRRADDSKMDLASVKIEGDLGANGTGSMGFHQSRERSRNDALGLPPRATKRIIDNFDIQTRHMFKEERVLFSNRFYYKKQDRSPSLDEIRYNPILDWMHSDDLRSYYRYSYIDRELEQIKSTTHSVDVGVAYFMLDQHLEMTVDAKGETYDSFRLQQDFYSGRLGLIYLQEFGLFDVRYTASWGADYTDRKASLNEKQVFFEHHILNDLTPVDLSFRNVVAGSITVENAASTLTFVEGADYRLIVFGDTTQIQRLPAGNIVSGEEVRVSYSYDTGGTAAFSGVSQLYRVDFFKGRYFNIFGQLQRLDRSLESGAPTLPLNQQMETRYGFRLDIPLGGEWVVGGLGEVQDYESESSSYQARRAGAYLQVAAPVNGRLRFFSDREWVDREDSPEDVDLIRHGIRYSANPGRRTTMSADIVDEEDVGGTRDRSRTSASARIDWGIRQLLVSAEVRYSDNILGDYEGERTRFDLFLSRRF